ncbi:MarR family transcriptional regulator [Salinirubellus sp. GCM10025818]|uniref:MarR family transcriptional regulator n=1 Tax=Salinirubellus TaxID=2162630 RepID=UPI0030D36755
MSRTGERSETPRAMIHQRILDVAKSNPSATLEGIADEISGASIDLVERVLEEYGDPAEDQQGGHDPEATPESGDRQDPVDGKTPENEDHDNQEEIMEQGSEDSVLRKEPPTMEETGDDELERESSPEVADEEDEDGLDGGSTVDAADLTEKQLRTLRLIAERPDATQGDLAERLDVTRATVSRWLSDIPEFEWTERQEFITKMLDDDENAEGATPDEFVQQDDRLSETEQSTPDGVGRSEFERLNERLDEIEGRLETMQTGTDTETESTHLVVGPELAHKVVHASINSDLLTEEEELQLLKDLRG